MPTKPKAAPADNKAPLDWLRANRPVLVQDLTELVAIPSISTDGEHQNEIDHTAEKSAGLMRQAGLENVEILRSGNSNPYAYGEYLHAPGKPTVFLYAHHDVQPVTHPDEWHTDPWKLTAKGGRLFGRGAADDKGAIPAQLGAIAAYLKTGTPLPVNVKVLVEGEEEVGSANLMTFFKEQKNRIQSDVVVVCDTGNLETGLPCVTNSLRGVLAALVEVRAAKDPVHSGTAGGAMADPTLALNVILARLYWKDGRVPIPGFYDDVRPLTEVERRTFKKLPGDEARFRKELGVLPGVALATEKGVHPFEQTWRLPSVTIIAQEASSIKGASNQVLAYAKAIVSCRIVPDQDPKKVFERLKAFLTADPPWGVKVTVKPHGSSGKWWITNPEGPAFEAAVGAMKRAYRKDPVVVGQGGAIPFVGPLTDLFGGAPALLLGIEDPKSNAHSNNESLHEGDWMKLMATLVHLFANLGSLEDGKVK